MIHEAAAMAGASLRSLGLELRDLLLRARKSTDEEIRTYPTPIPRCDAQFNFVYEQRSRVSGWLNEVDAALDRDDAPVALRAVMTEFCRAAPIDASIPERELRERIAAALSAPDAALRTPPMGRARGPDTG